MLLNLFRSLKTVHAWHVQVHDDQAVRRARLAQALPNHLNGLLTAGRLKAHQFELGEHGDQSDAAVQVVLHDEHWRLALVQDALLDFGIAALLC